MLVKKKYFCWSNFKVTIVLSWAPQFYSSRDHWWDSAHDAGTPGTGLIVDLVNWRFELSQITYLVDTVILTHILIGIANQQNHQIYTYVSIHVLCIYTYLSIVLSFYLSIYLSTYLPIYLSTYLRIYLSIYLSVYLSVCLSIYQSNWRFNLLNT